MSFNPPPEDREVCDDCNNQVVWGDLVEYRGNYYCEECFQAIMQDQFNIDLDQLEKN